MRALIAIAVLAFAAAPAGAGVEKPSPPGKVRLVIPPGVHDATIALRFDDSVIHPAPPVAPLTVVITPSVNLDPAIFLIEAPVAHPMIAVAVLEVPRGPDAALLELGSLGLLGLCGLVLARRHVRSPQVIGTL